MSCRIGLGLILLMSGCAPALWEPRPGDFSREEARVLLAGRHLYTQKCSGCHNLPLPESRVPETWTQAVDEMNEVVKLSDQERILVIRYLETAARANRPQVAQGEQKTVSE